MALVSAPKTSLPQWNILGVQLETQVCYSLYMWTERGEEGMQAIGRQDVDWINAARVTVRCGYSNGVCVQDKRGSLATVSLWRPLIILNLETDGWREMRKVSGGCSTENLNNNHSENIRSSRTSCLRVFCVILITNSDYFPKQQWLIGLSNGDLKIKATFVCLQAHTTAATYVTTSLPSLALSNYTSY